MKKGIIWLLLIAMLLAVMTGCGGQKQAEEPEADDQAEETLPPEESIPSEEPDVETEAPDQTETPKPPAETPEETAEPTPEPEQPASVSYTDNFSVSSEDASAYAQQVQQVVKDQNLDAFTDMIAFPIYVMGADGGQSITSASDFKALGAENIFTDAFVTEIISANTDGLNPSRAGFVLSATGRPNLVFGVVNGELDIVSLNY